MSLLGYTPFEGYRFTCAAHRVAFLAETREQLREMQLEHLADFHCAIEDCDELPGEDSSLCDQHLRDARDDAQCDAWRPGSDRTFAR